MSDDPSATGPFAGVRVIELQGLGPAPFGTMLLADLGADVIRVERPPSANLSEHAPRDASDLFARGKRSIALDLKRADDLATARELIDFADVLVDPYRPGVAERLGLGPDLCLERNPRLIFSRMTGWGQCGPLAHAVGHDIDYIALIGALHPLGDPDRPPPVPLNFVGDYGGGGLLLAFGVAAALHERGQSGRGQVLDVAMIDGIASLMTILFRQRAAGTWTPERGSTWLDGAAPWYRTYRTSDDRFVAIGALEPPFFAGLLARLGLAPEDWPQWDKSAWPRMRASLETIFAGRTQSDWCAVFDGADACFAPVLTLEEAADHPHVRARETFVSPDGVLQPAPSPRFSRTPGKITRRPPYPGEHTDEVIAELSARRSPAATEGPRR